MTDQPEMIERVARAIYAVYDPGNTDPWDVAVEREARYGVAMNANRALALKAALAALGAFDPLMYGTFLAAGHVKLPESRQEADAMILVAKAWIKEQENPEIDAAMEGK
jgi:hypothetical protein